MRAIFSAALLVSVLALAVPTAAQTPTDNDLQEIFDARNDPVDSSTDGAITPTTFVPDCVIEFEFILREAGFDNVFGWYNVTGSAPADSPDELFPLIDSSMNTADVDNTTGDSTLDGDGYVATLDIRNDPRYLGGEIGFFLKTPDGDPSCSGDTAVIGEDCGSVFYSQNQFNSDDTNHLLIYNSIVDRGFYFAWEDQVSGGDQDFSDIVTFVNNIVCSGAGQPCDTGEDGVCANGTLQCQAGELACQGQVLPGERTETCNGLDDDCDGMVDEGDDICFATQACRFGECITRCSAGEIDCRPGTTCVDEVCVDNACVGVECDPGQVCREGTCENACTGVRCPQGETCDPFVGGCVNPCEGIDCGDGFVCIDGVCQTSCQCRPERCTDDGLTCGNDGLCKDPACNNVTCDAGFRCMSGECVDACLDVVCPEGQICELGQCVQAPPGTGEDGGTGPGDDGGTGPGDDGGPGTGGDAAVGDDGGPGTGGAGSGDGCGCHVPGGPAPSRGPLGAAGLALLAGLAFWRRRTRS